MASKIILSATPDANIDSNTAITSSRSSSIALTPTATPSAAHSVAVQRMVKTPSGTQIYLQALPNTSSASSFLKRAPLPADHNAQPPAKIKLTYNSVNANVPITNAVPIKQEAVTSAYDVKPNIVLRAGDASRSPVRAMIGQTHVARGGVEGGAVRKLILSPVKQSSTGKITMVPLNTSASTSATPSPANRLVSLNRTLSGGVGGSSAVFSQVKSVQGVSASPTKLIIKNPDVVSY